MSKELVHITMHLKHLAKKLIFIATQLRHPSDFPSIFRNEPIQFSFDPNKWICANFLLTKFISIRGSENFDNYIPCLGLVRAPLVAKEKMMLWSSECGLNAPFKVWTLFTTFHLSYCTPSNGHYHQQKTNRRLDVVESKFRCIFFI